MTSERRFMILAQVDGWLWILWQAIPIGRSPYSAMWNYPIKYTDPDGRCPICPGSYYYTKASLIFSQFTNNIKAPSQRLLTGQSGNLNSEYSSQLRNSQASLMSTVSTINDGMAIASSVKVASAQGGLLGAEVVQGFGTAIEVAGIATAQPEITLVGGWVTGAGSSLLEGTIKALTGDLTTNEIGYQVGKGIVFNQLFKGGDKAETLSKEANNVWQVIVKGWEMLSDWTWELGTGGDDNKNK